MLVPHRWITFQHVWYSVDLPSGMEPPPNPKEDAPGGKPRLYLLKACSHACCAHLLPGQQLLFLPGMLGVPIFCLVSFDAAPFETHPTPMQDVTGAFRPGVLTALIGETGAGKTTLMDVLAGRKTTGMVEGDIRVKVGDMMPSVQARLKLAPSPAAICGNSKFGPACCATITACCHLQLC